MDKPVPTMVRCLGPGPEHVFLSRDARNNRVCSKCRYKIDSMNLSAQMENSFAVVPVNKKRMADGPTELSEE